MSDPADMLISVRGEARRAVPPDYGTMSAVIEVTRDSKAAAVHTAAEDLDGLTTDLVAVGGVALEAGTERHPLTWSAQSVTTLIERAHDKATGRHEPTGRVTALVELLITVRAFDLLDRLGALLAGLFLAVDLVLWNHAIAEVGAGIATVLGNLQVLFVAFAAWAAFRERPTRAFLVALPVVMAGVVLVSGLVGSSERGIHPVAGIVYGVGTSVAYAGFLLILRRTSTGTPHVAGPLAEATAGAALGSLLLGLAFGGLQFQIPWPSFWWLLLLSVTSQTIGWLLITSSLPRLPAAVSSLLLLLQPAAALLLAFAVLGERPTLIQLAGALLVCTGALAVSLAATSQRGRPGDGGDEPADPAVGDDRREVHPREFVPTSQREPS